MAHQRHDKGRSKAKARLEAQQRTSTRISRTTVEVLAASLVKRGLVSQYVLEPRNTKKEVNQ